MLDDNPVNIAYNNDYGLMQLPIPAGDHTLFMAFRETKSRFLADVLAGVCIIIYFGLYAVPVLIKKINVKKYLGLQT